MSIWHLYLYLEFLYFSLQLEHRLSSSSLTSASSDSDPESPSPTQLRRERRPAIYDAQVRTILMFLNVTETAGVKGFLRQLSWKFFFWKSTRRERGGLKSGKDLYFLSFNVVKSRTILTQPLLEKKIVTAFHSFLPEMCSSSFLRHRCFLMLKQNK